jgi:hypothetical protein
MKKGSTCLPVMLLLLFGVNVRAQHYKVQTAFTLKEPAAVVEGMTYDPVAGNFYFGDNLSCRILIYTNEGIQNGFIDGANDGMTSLLGMTVSKAGHLWVCSAIQQQQKKIMCLFQYNVGNGKLINRYPDTSGLATLFNDVAVTADGSVYITDTYTKSLFTIDHVGKIATRYLQNDTLLYANGISADGNILYISTAHGFARIDTKDKSLSIATFKKFVIAGNDGLYFYDHSLIGIQNVFYPVTIARFFLETGGKKVSTAKILAADHPAFKMPATGVVIDGAFYFMSNNNIEHFDFDSKKLSNDSLPRITLSKIDLEK